MARKTTRMVQQHPRVAEGRPLQFKDLDRTGQQIAKQNWSEMGNVASNIDSARSTARGTLGTPGLKEGAYKGASRDIANLTAAQEIGVTDKPQTIRSAAGRRVTHLRRAVDRAATEGDIRRTRDVGPTRSGIPGGIGWYLDHADDIDRAARIHDHDTPTAITASGDMSPQNSPENEKRAVAALMKGQSQNATVTAKTRRGAKAIGADNPGDTRNFRDLDPHHVRAIGSTPMAEHVDSSVSLTDLGKGSTELQSGLRVLRGEISRDEIGRDSAKLPSYIGNIHDAHVADANVRSEYFRRAHEAFTDKPYFEQPTVFGEEWEKDPYGKAQSTEGILDPEGHTAEDTWMQAMSLGQKNEAEVIPTGKGSARLGKLLGSNAVLQSMSVQRDGETAFPTPTGEKKVTGTELRHAMNNAATIAAARQVSTEAESRGRNVGAGVPSMMVQEGAWTEFRIAQGKDPLYEDAVKASSAPPAGIPDSGKTFDPKKPRKSAKTEEVLSKGLPGNWVQDKLL